MTNKKYGVALIGCDKMGAAHMEHIYYKDNIRVECVCDIDKTRSDEFAKRFNSARVQNDWKTVLSVFFGYVGNPWEKIPKLPHF